MRVTEVVGNSCFSSFMAETRSSKSFTASLKDFVIKEFEVCSLGATKVCQVPSVEVPIVPPNPIVDTDGLSFITRFDVTFTNTGFAKVFDPAIKEDLTFNFIHANAIPNTEQCKITKVAGSDVAPVPLPGGTFVDVPGTGLEIEPGGSLVVEVTCDTARNPFENEIVAGVRLADGGGAIDLTQDAKFTKSTTNACAAALSPGIKVTKECHVGSGILDGVRLMVTKDSNNKDVLAVEVLVDITVENTGNEHLQLVTVNDNKIGSLTSHIPNGVLTPGQKVTIPTQSYMPIAADQPDIPLNSGKYQSVGATFSDTVTASGQGTTSLQTKTDMRTAVCDLCPTP